MDKPTAVKIIRDTFEAPFDRDRYIYLVKNLFKSLDDRAEAAALKFSHQQISDNFKPFIEKYERIGKYEDAEGNRIDALIIYLEKETSLERARTKQRDFIARYLRGSSGRDEKDAAIVAFVSPNHNDWRFSLVKMEYRLTKTGEGKVKPERELTPARRSSFLVGEHETSHTAQSQLLSTLQSDTDPLLSDFEEAFSVEKVTKEFFQEYRKLYEMLVAELNNNQTYQNEASKHDLVTQNFAKKLLGQIVFLYFLQKKGWLGVPADKSWGEGDKFFLRHLFERSENENKNFFDNYLEVLFYDTLNNPRRNTPDPSYSKHFNCRVPFLNGGLFEPDYDWKNSFMYLENKTFEKILGVFDLYNFTVKEDEPLEKEVAVDPEMLGKVFENLLEESLRKGKGTYYTPREIVHYMCRESIVNYLKTETSADEDTIRKLADWDETGISPEDIETGEYKDKVHTLWAKEAEDIEKSLKSIRVVDPACGSGAFLVGMLQEIVRMNRKVAKFTNNVTPEYRMKKEVIQNSIFGVDIDPGAVEIAKLRLWLSLIVDFELGEIEPLPNLDYKIMVGNSLIEMLSPTLLVKSTDHKRNELIEDLNEAKKRFFASSDMRVKRQLREEINSLTQLLVNYDRKKERDRLWQELLAHRSQTKMFKDEASQSSLADAEKTLAQKLEKMGQLKDVSETDHFEWHLNFNEVFNEKGGFDVVIANPPYVRISGIKDAYDELLRSNYVTTFGHYDLYIPFFEKGAKLLNEQGILAYITPNKYLTKRYGNKLRPFLLKNYKILELIDTSKAKTFDTASVYPVITILTSCNESDEPIFVAIVDDASFHRFFGGGKSDIGYAIPQRTFIGNENHYMDIFINPTSRELVNKISQGAVRLGDYARTLTGTPAISKYYEWDKLLFHVDSVPKNKKALKFINVSSIGRYIVRWGKKVRAVGKTIEKPYLVFDEKLVGKNKWSVFERKKIVIKGTAKRLTAAYDSEGFANLSLYAVVFNEDHHSKTKTYYHLGILNSTLIDFWYRQKFATANLSGNYISFNGVYLQQIPVKQADIETQVRIQDKVEKILALTQSDNYLESPTKQAKVKEYGKQIDQMVYKLYGLTPEEISIVEGGDKKWN